MKYHIDTIPVWDALKENPECLMCKIKNDVEKKYVEFYLGDSVMQPDIREKTNKLGFCDKHYKMMYEKKLKLPLGLSSYTRLEYLREDLNKYFDKIIKEEKQYKKSGATECISYINNSLKSCLVCDSIDEGMNRYYYTFVYLWKTDDEFRKTYLGSKGVCLPHFSKLLEFGESSLSAQLKLQFAKDMAKVQKANIERLSEELKWFNDKFDHRNVSAPWGNSKDALPRVLNKISGIDIQES